MGMFGDILRGMFFTIDSIVYSYIPSVYNFLVELSTQEIFKIEDIEIIAGNIYTLLGIFMIFRLSFVLLNAIIDPDMLNDKERGASKFVLRIIVSLVLIVVIPWMFSFARNFQENVIESDVLEKIVFGNTSDKTDEIDPGLLTAKYSLQAFINSDDEDRQKKMEDELFRTIKYGESQGAEEILNDRKNGTNEHVYSYSFLVSTACGIVILLILITFSIDIATRVAKLGFLQLIAPIAVFGYIEPKGTIFSKWLKVVVSTYLNLFLRLFSLYFATYLISKVSGNLLNNVDGLIRVFLIMGILFFAKEAPKLLLTILGINEESLGTLNPFKKIKEMPGSGYVSSGAGATVGLGAKVAGGVVGGISGGIAARNRGGSIMAGMGQGAKTGFGNVKLGDSQKGGISGMGKSLMGGTFGAAGASRNYVASKISGKEEKIGFMQGAKDKMANIAAEMNAKKLSKAEDDRYKELQQRKQTSKDNSYYKDKDYSAAVDNLNKFKGWSEQTALENQRWANLYQKEPTNDSYRINYENAAMENKRAQAAVEFYKNNLEKMDQNPKYSNDAADRKIIEKYELKEKMKNLKIPEDDDNNPYQQKIPFKDN